MTPLNPTTSLCMIYLRAYARDASTRRGMVRSGRKAMHMLRMHWSACAQDPRKGTPDRRERISALENVPQASGGIPA